MTYQAFELIAPGKWRNRLAELDERIPVFLASLLGDESLTPVVDDSRMYADELDQQFWSLTGAEAVANGLHDDREQARLLVCAATLDADGLDVLTRAVNAVRLHIATQAPDDPVVFLLSAVVEEATQALLANLGDEG